MAEAAMEEPTGWRKRPGWARRRIGDPAARLLMRRLGGRRGGVLRTMRSDGSWRTVPLGLWHRGQDRYLVGLFGQTLWVRDIRAGRPAQLEGRRAGEPSYPQELSIVDAAEFLAYFVNAFPGPSQRYLGVSREAEGVDFSALASRHPVFRLVGTPTSGTVAA